MGAGGRVVLVFLAADRTAGEGAANEIGGFVTCTADAGTVILGLVIDFDVLPIAA
jgi:hypothetical protein